MTEASLPGGYRGAVTDIFREARASIPPVRSVTARRVTLTLPTPVILGEYVIRARSYAVVTVELMDGSRGTTFAIDRGTPVADSVTALIAEPYRAMFDGDPVATFDSLLRAMSPALSSGASMRGLSLVDLATHDAIARHKGVSVAEHCGAVPRVFPRWAVVGYPPSRGPEDIAWEVTAAVAAGAVGVKLPLGSSPALTRERLIAAIGASSVPVATDLAWSCRTPQDVLSIVGGLNLAWVEDPMLPGSLQQLRELRGMLDVPLASGDDEANLYHPRAFLATGAVDIVRLDATCNGGLSRLLLLDEELVAGGFPVSWHVYDPIHSQIAAIMTAPTFAVEYSAPGCSVDPLAELILDRYDPTAPGNAIGFGMIVPDLPDVSPALGGPPRWRPAVDIQR